MTRLSVNINKIATLRNARGGNYPNVLDAAINCQRFGAEGITVHPRPDERHIRYQDVYDIKPIITTEFNIEGYPSEDFIKMVLDVKPNQVTLVPDPPDALTSNAGWDTINNKDYLKGIISRFQSVGIRTSIFRASFAQLVFSILQSSLRVQGLLRGCSFPAGRQFGCRVRFLYPLFLHPILCSANDRFGR